MSKRKTSYTFWGEPKEDPHTEKTFLSKLLEAVVVFVVACFLVKLAVNTVLSVKVPLIVISLVLLIALVAYRAYKKRRHDDY